MKLYWISLMLTSLLISCASVPNGASPPLERIEALARWSAYLASLNAGVHNREPLQKAAETIRDLSKATPLTPAMALAALHAAGATWLSCPEGVIAVTGVIMLEDVAYGRLTIQDEQAIRALLRGVADGIFLGLALATGDGTPQEKRLEEEALRLRYR